MLKVNDLVHLAIDFGDMPKHVGCVIFWEAVGEATGSLKPSRFGNLVDSGVPQWEGSGKQLEGARSGLYKIMLYSTEPEWDVPLTADTEEDSARLRGQLEPRELGAWHFAAIVGIEEL